VTWNLALFGIRGGRWSSTGGRQVATPHLIPVTVMALPG
jgi:hypothetical protein